MTRLNGTPPHWGRFFSNLTTWPMGGQIRRENFNLRRPNKPYKNLKEKKHWETFRFQTS
jgi:hypothetical protein